MFPSARSITDDSAHTSLLALTVLSPSSSLWQTAISYSFKAAPPQATLARHRFPTLSAHPLEAWGGVDGEPPSRSCLWKAHRPSFVWVLRPIQCIQEGAPYGQ